ncbi:hypothetical protein ACTXOR_02830 [Arthrobacter rhombi]|uniref:Knr4/Smi1-like domain-containing protein n=1 Tax=Arthrobacter rhombi TaxID=71253 RepID=A0A1R4GV73_9MICC|nr:MULTISPECIES: hypothetical protein [Micrococcaceae]PCC25961.1 hypothetical protein CIK75_05715 [Glutamicibacter sp. BW78]SJM72107.1 hypothetical protein FM101_14375 [Arthrobacter rhombi]
MAEMFVEKFRSLIPKYLDDQWVSQDGLTSEELGDELSEAGVEIPQVLQEFYLAVGACDDLMEAYYFFFDPDELEIEDGYLLFMEDEDEQHVWGFRADQLDIPDPIVHRRRNSNGSWDSEEGTFSEYVLDMFEWVFEELEPELEV